MALSGVRGRAGNASSLLRLMKQGWAYRRLSSVQMSLREAKAPPLFSPLFTTGTVGILLSPWWHSPGAAINGDAGRVPRDFSALTALGFIHQPGLTAVAIRPDIYRNRPRQLKRCAAEWLYPRHADRWLRILLWVHIYSAQRF
jgi:hypothetical protein